MAERLIDKFVPTRSPYRIERTSHLTGQRWFAEFDDMGNAMADLMHTPSSIRAELSDADGKFIARANIAPQSATAGQGGR